jgi:hypothetical protein
MLIIGCDFHTCYQQIAMAREKTGEAGGPETVSVHFLLEPWRTEGAPGSFFEPGSWVCLLSLLFHVHRHEPRPSSIIKPPTAPHPIFRMFHQPANHRIRMHVIQLLRFLPPAVHIEIVKPRLPKRPQQFSRLLKRQSHLAGGTLSTRRNDFEFVFFCRGGGWLNHGS